MSETPLTFEKFVSFYQEVIEPRFLKIESRMESFDQRFDQIDRCFDDLYKKFETLHQEYLVISGQLQRIEENQRIDRQSILTLKTQVADLQRRIEILESRIDQN